MRRSIRRKHMISFYLAALLLLNTVMPVSVQAADEAATEISVDAKNNNVGISQKKAVIYIGQTVKLKIFGTSKKVTWSSSEKSVATVGKNGKVTGKTDGKTVITGKAGKKQYKCTIIVKMPELSSVQIFIEAGLSQKLSLKGATAISWKSDHPFVASVSNSGKVTTHRAGIANIICTDSKNRTYTCKFEVWEEEEEETYPDIEQDHEQNDGQEADSGSGAGGSTGTGTGAGNGSGQGQQHVHVYDVEVIEPTCRAEGYTLHTCSLCGKSYQDTCTEKLPHQEEIGIKEQTCTNWGYYYYYCAVCKSRLGIGEMISPHHYRETITDNGYIWRECEVCGMRYGSCPDSLNIADAIKNRSSYGFSDGAKQVLDKAFSIIDTIISDGMTDEQKVKAIHDYLIYNAKYYNNGDYSNAPKWAYAAEGVLLHNEGVCQSYAYAFDLLAEIAGLDCRYVRNENHGWNKVLVDGSWYYIDCTWDDPVGVDKIVSGHERYMYYLSPTLWEGRTMLEEIDLVEERIVNTWDTWILTSS